MKKRFDLFVIILSVGCLSAGCWLCLPVLTTMALPVVTKGNTRAFRW